MADDPNQNNYQNSIRSTIMSRMNALLGSMTTTSSAASSSSPSSPSTTASRPSVTMLPIARIDSPQPDNRVNLARVMYRLGDLITHLHNHYQATLPEEDASESAKIVPRSRQTSTEFRLWIGKTRRAGWHALAIRARTQVAVHLPGFVARKSKVLGEYPSHFEEYFGLFCGNIATAAGVKYSLVHDLAFAMGLEVEAGVGGSCKHAAENEMEKEGEGVALEYAAMQMFAFPNAHWAFCVAVEGPSVLVKRE